MMTRQLNHLLIVGGAAAALSVLAGTGMPAYAVQSASGIITAATVSSTEWQYNLTLKNTGSTTIGTFWFAWVPGQSYMSANPTDVTAPANWEAGPLSTTTGGYSQGASIEWQAVASSDYLQSTGTLSGFGFRSTESPAAMFGNSTYFTNVPTTTSFVYQSGPFTGASAEFVATQAVPEPRSLGLIAAAGVLALTLRSARQFRYRARIT